MVRNMLLWTAVAFMAAGAVAQPGPGGEAGAGMKQRRAFFVERADKLNLTDQQKKEMQNLRIELQRKNIPLQSQVRLARLEIQQLMAAEKPEKGKIEKWMKEVSDLQLQMKLNGVNHMFAVRAILTPEQLKEWKDGRHSGMGMGRDMRPGTGMRGRVNAPMMERRFRWIEGEDGAEVEVGEDGDDEQDVVIERKIENKGGEKTIRLKVEKKAE